MEDMEDYNCNKFEITDEPYFVDINGVDQLVDVSKYDPIFVLDHTYNLVTLDDVMHLEDIVSPSYQAIFNCFYNSDLFDNMRNSLSLFLGKGSTKEINDDDLMDYMFSDNFIHIMNHKKNMLNELKKIERKKIFKALYKLHIDKNIDEIYLIKEIIDHVL